MDFDICCFELASLDVLISADSRLKPVGEEIWYPCSVKRVLEPKSTVLRRLKKCHFFGVRKIDVFSDAQPDVVDHPESTV